MKESILDVLKGKFLISEGSIKNWRFILFASLLAVLMIASSHNIDKKVIAISGLDEEVKELKSEFVDVRSELQSLRLESTIIERLNSEGLMPSKEPPKKIKLASRK